MEKSLIAITTKMQSLALDDVRDLQQEVSSLKSDREPFRSRSGKQAMIEEQLLPNLAFQRVKDLQQASSSRGLATATSDNQAAMRDKLQN